ncbi:hypothetical protein MRB53_037260 [Persea americana]|nr:hypothetical protein MRB53_037260 [Persea americana]
MHEKLDAICSLKSCLNRSISEEKVTPSTEALLRSSSTSKQSQPSIFLTQTLSNAFTMYIDLFHKAGATSLASAALLGWLIALQRAEPSAVKAMGIQAPNRIMQLHLDQVMMGLILLASGTAFPDMPDHFAGPLLLGCFLNPLGFVPMAFFPGCDKTLVYRAAIGFSFISSSIGFVGMAYHACHGKSSHLHISLLSQASHDRTTHPVFAQLSDCQSAHTLTVRFKRKINQYQASDDMAAETDLSSQSFFRSVPFQIVIVSLVSFTAPGMWDALGGLGAGGAAEPYAVSAANAIVYGIFGVICIIAAALNNKIGLRYSLAIGAVGYPLYGAALYMNSTNPTTWFLLFGSAVCGVSAAFLWSAQPCIIMGYPSPDQQGFYLAVWQAAKCAGPIVGGAINLALNANTSTPGGIRSTTYIAFIAIMCLGLPLALCLSPPSKVWRRNGSKIIIEHHSLTAEFRALLSVICSRRLWLLLPGFVISFFFYGFMSTWLTLYFTVRARAFSSLVTNFAGIISSFAVAALLDRQTISIKFRAYIAFSAITFLMLGVWTWIIVLQYDYYNTSSRPVFDWSTNGFGSAYAVMFFLQFTELVLQTFLQWLIGQYILDISSLSHYLGVLFGAEAIGQAVAWILQSQGELNHFITIGLNLGIFVLSIVPTLVLINELDDRAKDPEAFIAEDLCLKDTSNTTVPMSLAVDSTSISAVRNGQI